MVWPFSSILTQFSNTILRYESKNWNWKIDLGWEQKVLLYKGTTNSLKGRGSLKHFKSGRKDVDVEAWRYSFCLWGKRKYSVVYKLKIEILKTYNNHKQAKWIYQVHFNVAKLIKTSIFLQWSVAVNSIVSYNRDASKIPEAANEFVNKQAIFLAKQSWTVRA